MFDNLRNVLLDPLNQGLDTDSEFATKWGEAVLHLGWFSWVNHAEDKSICFKRMKGVCEHALADPANSVRKFTEAMRSLQEHDQDERTPT